MNVSRFSSIRRSPASTYFSTRLGSTSGVVLAERALQVGELDHRHRGIGVAERDAALRDAVEEGDVAGALGVFGAAAADHDQDHHDDRRQQRGAAGQCPDSLSATLPSASRSAASRASRAAFLLSDLELMRYAARYILAVLPPACSTT